MRVDEPGGPREIQAAVFPISIDAAALSEIARRDDVRKPSAQICDAVGEPGLVLLGMDRLDYTKASNTGCAPTANWWPTGGWARGRC